jgi:predicted nuclease of predicted toxin-antitoxin system
MKLLLDTCASRSARDHLRSRGHELVWSAEFAVDPGDRALLRMAFEEGRILITLDKDFGELAVHRSEPHRGILRLVGFPAHAEGPAAVAALDRYSAVLLSGAIVTVEPGRVRIREPEQGTDTQPRSRRDSPPGPR